VSLSSERQNVPARGMQGGGEGARGAFILNPGTPEERKLPAAAGELALPRGSLLRIATPAGGGFGKAAARAEAASERDVREERLSAGARRRVKRR
jgi:N-methylhydantoinase B